MFMDIRTGRKIMDVWTKGIPTERRYDEEISSVRWRGGR